MATKKSGMAEKLANKTAALGDFLEGSMNSPAPAKPPVTMPGQLGAFRLEAQRYHQRINELEAELQKAMQTGAQAEVKVAELHEAPGRRRKLSREEYGELTENLRHNPLVTPITVRRREEGGYEIISGHNRVAVFRDLGRETIPAVIADTDQAQADINAFYANLLQTTLPDFEKYRGFKMLQERFPGLTQSEIANRSGKSQSLISQLMSFDKLPAEVTALLEDNPGLIGAAAAARLAILAEQGKAKQVIEAVGKIVTEGIDQNEAVKRASANPASKPAAPKPVAVTIKEGRSTYCQMHRAKKVIRLEFKSEEEAEAIQDAVRDFLEARLKLAGQNDV